MEEGQPANGVAFDPQKPGPLRTESQAKVFIPGSKRIIDRLLATANRCGIPAVDRAIQRMSHPS